MKRVFTILFALVAFVFAACEPAVTPPADEEVVFEITSQKSIDVGVDGGASSLSHFAGMSSQRGTSASLPL